MNGDGHRGVDLRDTDLGGVSVHSVGLVKMSSDDSSSSSSGDEWGWPPWRRPPGHRPGDLDGGRRRGVLRVVVLAKPS